MFKSREKTMDLFIVTVRYVVLIFFALVAFFPIFWLLETSFKIPRQYFSYPLVWIPTPLTLEHYIELFTLYEAVKFLKNSLIIAFVNMILVLVVSIPAAYAISRYKAGGASLSLWILIQRMLPPVAVIIPLFLLFMKANLIDTHIGLIVAYTVFNIPLAVWLLMSFFGDFPVEIQEASMVDGCTELQSLYKVVLPVIAPGIVVTALFCFLGAWNELMMAITFTRTNAGTIPILITTTLQEPTSNIYGVAAGMAVFAVVPAFVLTLSLQKYIVRGLTLGAVKG